jgi:menaquinone reductase, multiheme cytochrome c subunit
MSSNDSRRTSDNSHLSHPDSGSRGAYVLLFFIIGIVVSMVFGWVVFPKLLYSRKSQPFDFNHKRHLELVGDGCQSCHFFRPDGSFSSVPRLAQCLQCHEEMQGRSSDEAIFFQQYVEQGREVPWRLYARQPDSVFFSHAAHIYGARIACETCHGPIGTSESLKPYEENRITGYSRDIWGWNIAGFKQNAWDRMKMDDCAQCHQQAGEIHDSSVQTGRDACFVCHK